MASKVTKCTVDSNVLALAMAAVNEIRNDELRVAFGSWDWIISLGPEKPNLLLFLQAFSGCDTVSSFAGCGRKTAWEIEKICDEVTPVFYTLASNPDPNSIGDQLEALEHFLVLLYDWASTEMRHGNSFSLRKVDQ